MLYRAPECANNFRRATVQADIYSFGAILHDIFHGGHRVPHSKLTVAGAIGPVVARCTESKTRRRYRSVAALREALFTVLTDKVIEFESEEEREVIDLITSQENLSEDQWEKIFDIIDDNLDRDESNYNILCAISGVQIESLYSIAPDMFHGLGEEYARFAESNSFGFDYCDNRF